MEICTTDSGEIEIYMDRPYFNGRIEISKRAIGLTEIGVVEVNLFDKI